MVQLTPKPTQPRAVLVAARLSESDATWLKSAAQAAGISISEAINQIIARAKEQP